MTCCDLNAILSGLDTPNRPCYLEVCAGRAAHAAARGRATRSARAARTAARRATPRAVRLIPRGALVR